MKKQSIEIIVGLFVCIGLAGMAYTSIHLGQVDFFSNNFYTIDATFASVTGLKKDTDIEISGVKIGKVNKIVLEDYQAVVTMSIHKDVLIQDDSIASIRTKGILGEQYISISPGGSDITLQPGDALFDTEPPFDLLGVIKNFIMSDE